MYPYAVRIPNVYISSPHFGVEFKGCPCPPPPPSQPCLIHLCAQLRDWLLSDGVKAKFLLSTSIKKQPLSLAMLITSVTSFAFIPIGISHSTCFFASRNILHKGKCWIFTDPIWTISVVQSDFYHGYCTCELIEIIR